MNRAAVAFAAALSLLVLGQLLVIGGVLARGLFRPGAVLVALGLVAFAAAAVLDALGRRTPTA